VAISGGYPVASDPRGVYPIQGAAPARPDRSWTVVELPAFDPVAFARQRRHVMYGGAVLFAVFLIIAFAAGRCDAPRAHVAMPPSADPQVNTPSP
jgi:hypothetical protein